MNPELILSFVLMQGLAPAGTSVPVEAVLTSADAMPAWARFTFQVFVIQKLQEEVNACKAELDKCREHHEESHEKSRQLKEEIRTLFKDPEFAYALQRSDLPRLKEIVNESSTN